MVAPIACSRAHSLRKEGLGSMVDELEPHAVVTHKGLAVALVTISRYLAAQQPDYRLFLRAASDHAAASGLPPTDLAFLELLIKSIT